MSTVRSTAHIANVLRQSLHDLTHSLHANIPHVGEGEGFHVNEEEGYAKRGYLVQSIEMHLRAGTHIDAPAHHFSHGKTVDQIPLDDLEGPVVVIKLAHKRVIAKLVVTANDIQEFENRHGRIPEGSIVIIYTGWGELWDEREHYNNLANSPSLSIEAAQLLMERNVKALGMDTFSPDQIDEQNLTLPVHQLFLGNGKYLIENVPADAKKLPPTGSSITVAPLKIQGGSEAPVRLIARVNEYPELPKRKLLNGKPIALTTIGLGCASLGDVFGKLSDDQAYGIVNAAVNAGVEYFDTALLYGVGKSPERLSILNEHRRDRCIISSKLGMVIKPGGTRSKVDSHFFDGQENHVEFDYSYHGIMETYQQNLQKLCVNYLDIAFVHDLGRFVHGDRHEAMLDMFFNQGGIQALQELREQKLIGAFGLGVNEYQVCVEVMKKGFFPDCIMLAGRYTLLDQRVLESEFFDLCQQHQVSVIIAGVHNSGILTGNSNNKSFDYADASPEIYARKEAIRQVCEEHGVLLPQAALQFPLLHPQVISVVSGPRKPEEITQSVAHLQTPIDPAFWHCLQEKGLISPKAPIPTPTIKLVAGMSR